VESARGDDWDGKNFPESGVALPIPRTRVCRSAPAAHLCYT